MPPSGNSCNDPTYTPNNMKIFMELFITLRNAHGIDELHTLLKIIILLRPLQFQHHDDIIHIIHRELNHLRKAPEWLPKDINRYHLLPYCDCYLNARQIVPYTPPTEPDTPERISREHTSPNTLLSSRQLRDKFPPKMEQYKQITTMSSTCQTMDGTSYRTPQKQKS